MIKGTKYWADRSYYYIQTNDPTEELLRKRKDGPYLVSCGPGSSVCCMAAMGEEVSIRCPGEYQPQPEEVLMDFFNDPRNYELLRRVRPETDPYTWYGNEIPQFYPLAVREVFGVEATFAWCKDINQIAGELQAGRAVQLCLIKPGHYLAAVAWDEERRQIIYNDPWPDRFPEHDGFNRRMSEAEYKANVKDFIIVYRGKLDAL